MILADLGAEVIKVEPPGGDKTRKLPGLGIGFFRSFNRNKKSIVLDIHSADGLAAAKELIGASDVVLENFRPGLMASLGLDHASLEAEFPHLIYVSHKGFLPGPYEKRVALDEVVQMMGGLSYVSDGSSRSGRVRQLVLRRRGMLRLPVRLPVSVRRVARASRRLRRDIGCLRRPDLRASVRLRRRRRVIALLRAAAAAPFSVST